MRTSFQICILSLVAFIIGVAAPRVNAQCTGDVIPSGIIDDSLLGNIAWYDSNSGIQTHIVGGKFANGLGLHDMSGNVGECCQDWYGSTYYGSSPLINPTGPATGTFRMVRGGDWYNHAVECRGSERRYHPTQDYAQSTHGFRAARNP